MAKYEKENYWLSNFFPVVVFIYTVTGKAKIACNCVETAFQALLAQNDAERLKISQMHPLEAKKYAYNNRLPMRADAPKIMKQLLKQKFRRAALKKQLMEADDSMFIHENGWHDNFWGICTCQTNRCLGKQKHNHLGKLLKQLKYEFIQEENRLKQLKKTQPEVASPAKEEETQLTGTDDLQLQLTGQKEEKPKPKAKKRTTRKAKTTNKKKGD